MTLAGVQERRTRWWRVVALLHSQASLVLAPLYLLPAMVLLAVMVCLSLWSLNAVNDQLGTLSALMGSMPDLAGSVRPTWFGAFLGSLPFLAAGCTALARAVCWLQARRLGAVVPDMVVSQDRARPVWFRVLRVLFGAVAWRSVFHGAVLGGWGVLAGSAVLILSAFGLGIPVGLLGASLAYVFGVSDFADLGAVELVGLLALGPVMAIGALGLAPAVVRVETALSHVLIIDPPEVQARRRLATLRETRRRMVDVAENERRRIERDLHDGAQQRLLALTISISRARGRAATGSEDIGGLLDEAHTEAKEAMAELRDVTLGLHPRVLTDHGLVHALPGVTGRCPTPVRLVAQLDERPSSRAEAVAYFVTSESLTNVAKHARGATDAEVRVERVGDRLRVAVRDNGAGGADPNHGTGLYGLWDRVHAVDGTLTVTSPPGGPTTLVAEVPWEA